MRRFRTMLLNPDFGNTELFYGTAPGTDVSEDRKSWTHAINGETHHHAMGEMCIKRESINEILYAEAVYDPNIKGWHDAYLSHLDELEPTPLPVLVS